jgi:hypothetical protein
VIVLPVIVSQFLLVMKGGEFVYFLRQERVVKLCRLYMPAVFKYTNSCIHKSTSLLVGMRDIQGKYGTYGLIKSIHNATPFFFETAVQCVGH